MEKIGTVFQQWHPNTQPSLPYSLIDNIMHNNHLSEHPLQKQYVYKKKSSQIPCF